MNFVYGEINKLSFSNPHPCCDMHEWSPGDSAGPIMWQVIVSSSEGIPIIEKK